MLFITDMKLGHRIGKVRLPDCNDELVVPPTTDEGGELAMVDAFSLAGVRTNTAIVVFAGNPILVVADGLCEGLQGE
jgi:hypothetical protein